jgi:hypothetical protein
MGHLVAHFLSRHFPKLGHLKYQSVLERRCFLITASTLIGLLTVSLVLVSYAL